MAKEQQVTTSQTLNHLLPPNHYHACGKDENLAVLNPLHTTKLRL